MKTQTLAALMILGLGAIAQAQEYQNQSTVYGHGYRQTTYEDGSTSLTTWHKNGLTGAITDVQTVNTHAKPKPTPPPVQIAQPLLTTVYNHDGRAFDNLPKAAPTTQLPVIVITGPMTPEEVRAFMNPTPRKD